MGEGNRERREVLVWLRLMNLGGERILDHLLGLRLLVQQMMVLRLQLMVVQERDYSTQRSRRC